VKADAREAVRQALVDFEFYCSTSLKVEDKQTGKLIPFVWKPIQRKLAEKTLERWLRGAPIRFIILKARREGVSTLVQAFIFWVCATRPNRRAFTVAHDDDTASYLHGMSERFYEQLPPIMRPQRRTARKGQTLEFANPSKSADEQRLRPGLNSSISTNSQKNAGAGKGAQLLHLSEPALWQPQTAKKTLDTILQVVPRAGETFVVLESTARGMGNEFHHRWLLAQGGSSEYEAIFFAWFEEPTYRESVPKLFERTEEEEELVHQFGLDDEQLEWRRLTIENECGGDIDTFHQEYPATPEEAFLATGRPYFNQRIVHAHLEKARETKPRRRGQLVERKVSTGEPWVVFEATKRGNLTIWADPDPDDDYLIFCDSSEGSTGDYQAAYVFPRSRLEIVAAWHGRVDRDTLGDELFMLGKLYGGLDGEALIAVEVSGGWGLVPLSVLKRRHYHRLYQSRTFDRRTNQRKISLGWKTTLESRALMLDALKQSLREVDPTEDASWTNDPNLLRECLTFVYDDAGKPQAEEGCFDDRVIAAAGAVYLWTAEPRRQKHEKPEPRKALSPVTGY
jgi:hypothetical protein